MAGKRGYTRKTSQSEFELEHGTDWKDTYTGNYGGDGATADGRPPFGANSSEEHLRGVEAHGKNGGIWRSTSVAVSHGEI
ncbi:hypothetical protein OEA41_003847 [Lepraria neglecta]|uniref:Uncharacterized protein n=1 Tax=Lepraria neglecta TaxID=209136 RepID=A0AAE0DLU4_9LECA|nr:hypothetical protein OEA41_003847 [Lepraria neglecta]